MHLKIPGTLVPEGSTLSQTCVTLCMLFLFQNSSRASALPRGQGLGRPHGANPFLLYTVLLQPLLPVILSLGRQVKTKPYKHQVVVTAVLHGYHN